MIYEQVTSISQLAALIFFMALFIGIVAYAFWPGNKKKFEEAAKLPFKQEPENGNGNKKKKEA